MTKFQFKNFLKAAYEIVLVFLQFFIIGLHFFQWEFIPKKQIIQKQKKNKYLKTNKGCESVAPDTHK